MQRKSASPSVESIGGDDDGKSLLYRLTADSRTVSPGPDLKIRHPRRPPFQIPQAYIACTGLGPRTICSPSRAASTRIVPPDFCTTSRACISIAEMKRSSWLGS